jgi:hypothetical protein
MPYFHNPSRHVRLYYDVVEPSNGANPGTAENIVFIMGLLTEG